MFKFLYSLHSNETNDLPEGFDGVEIQAGGSSQSGVFGLRLPNIREAGDTAGEAAYVMLPAVPVAHVRPFLAEGRLILIEPTNAVRTAREMWQWMELMDHPAVKICWPIAWGEAIGELAVIVVPMLNSRLGAVRVVDSGPQTLDAVRRLAGIGYGGYFVIDPPPGEDRRAAAALILAAAQNVLAPSKPAAKVPPKGGQKL